MMIDIGLVLARLLHYAATITLAGASFFPLYAYTGCEAAGLNRWRQGLLLATAAVSLVSGLFWFVFSAASMSGSMADLADPEVTWSLVRETSFGAVWTARMALAVVIVVITAKHFSPNAVVGKDPVTPLLAAALLASLAGTGHSQIEEGWSGVVHVGSDAAHLLAAGAWLGGLAPLGFILASSAIPNQHAGSTNIQEILMRFSGMGYGAVTILIGSGLVKSWFLVGSPSALLDTSYGQILMAKLALFAAMLALAAANRFWLVPSISGMVPGTYDRLRNHVLGEQLLGLLILLAVSVLGTMRPAIGQ
jgi:putative copper resistance protein D